VVPHLMCMFLTSCEAMEFAEMRQRREKHPDLPARLLIMVHASG